MVLGLYYLSHCWQCNHSKFKNLTWQNSFLGLSCCGFMFLVFLVVWLGCFYFFVLFFFLKKPLLFKLCIIILSLYEELSYAYQSCIHVVMSLSKT